jgi:type II secretory pathway pseudopilin PulG
MRIKHLKCAGFTMIEIAISLAIIAFALVAIIGILPYGMGVQRENREETIINQETGVLLNAICNGDQGLDDLTNYVVAITNTQTWYPNPSGRPETTVYGYTLTNSTSGPPPPGLPQLMNPEFPITNGFRIVGLLSTPKYVPVYSAKGASPEGFYSNHVVATVRAMSGSAGDKAPQRNASVQDMAFAYRMTSEVMPYGSGNPLAPYSSAWNPDWTNYTAYPNAADWLWRSNYFRYAENLQADLNEVRLLFRWPALPNGGLGSGRQVVRAVTAGPPQPFPNPPVDPAYTLYFAQPKTFVRAQ